jgi:hypothetical protein
MSMLSMLKLLFQSTRDRGFLETVRLVPKIWFTFCGSDMMVFLIENLEQTRME